MDEHSEMFQFLPFPLDGGAFPRQLGAVIQRTVLCGDEPARVVIHAEVGSWLVGDAVNDPNEQDACIAGHIWHAIEQDSSIVELVDLPPGHIATRSDPGDPWLVAAHHWEDK